MKLCLIVTVLLTAVAYADLGEEIQEKCKQPEAKALMGMNGSCQVVANPKPLRVSGSCKGNFSTLFPCEARFDSSQKSTHVICGTDQENPTLDSVLDTEFSEVRIATLIRSKTLRKNYVINDPTTYKKISNIALEINLDEVLRNGKVEKKPSMLWIQEGGMLEFTDVECSYN